METAEEPSSSSSGSSSSVMKIKKLGLHLHPYLTSDNTCLQVVLDPEPPPNAASILCPMSALCWSSENISIDWPQTTWQRIYYSGDLVQVSNSAVGQNPVYVALSSVSGSGKILEIPLTTNNSELHVVKGHFLCTSSIYNVMLRPVLSGNFLQNPMKWVYLTAYQIIKPVEQENGVVYVQACGDILKKCLSVGESIRIRSSCLVALDTKCTVRGSMYSSILDSIVSSKGFDMVIQGPGNVFFSADTVGRRKFAEGGGSLNRGGHGNAALLLKLISIIVTMTVVLTFTRMVEFEVIDGNQFFDGNGNDPFNRQPQQAQQQHPRQGRGWQL